MSKFARQNQSGAKLTMQMVVWGREQYALGLMNMRQLAEVQRVSRETVARYIRGETWKELGAPAEHEQAEEARLEFLAKETAPAPDSPEIQASLARLAQLMNKGSSSITGGPTNDTTANDASSESDSSGGASVLHSGDSSAPAGPGKADPA